MEMGTTVLKSFASGPQFRFRIHRVKSHWLKRVHKMEVNFAKLVEAWASHKTKLHTYRQ